MQALHLQSPNFNRSALQQNHAGPACCSLRGTPVPNVAFTNAAVPSQRRHKLQCRAASSDTFSGSSFSGNGNGLGLSGPGAPSSKPSLSIDDISLESEAGMDYAHLKDLLAAGDFQKADDETRILLIKLAGPGAIERKWVYFTEVKFIPEVDLRAIDGLWRAASNGKFGYSVQKEIWVQNRRYWERLFKIIDWTHGAHNYYRKWPQEFKYNLDAPKGHLPLTNCLRGTQLFKAILEHPAFERPAQGEEGNAKPDWLKETETKMSF